MNSGLTLYLITDRKLFSESGQMLQAVEQALQGGVRAVQLREKDLGVRELLDLACRMKELTSGYGARLFINDRVDVALAVEAYGAHLGRTGIPVQAARKASGGSLTIGVSAHSVQEAIQAQEDGADFVTLGPVYETPSKTRYGRPVGTEVLRGAAKALSIPVLAIGGITPERVPEVMRNGASGVALISAIMEAKDIRKTTEEFVRKLS
jgi:thiamine-phosphate pyrophosphorylase